MLCRLLASVWLQSRWYVATVCSFVFRLKVVHCAPALFQCFGSSAGFLRVYAIRPRRLPTTDQPFCVFSYFLHGTLGRCGRNSTAVEPIVGGAMGTGKRWTADAPQCESFALTWCDLIGHAQCAGWDFLSGQKANSFQVLPIADASDGEWMIFETAASLREEEGLYKGC